MKLVSLDKVIALTWKDPGYTDPINVLTELRDRVRSLPTVESRPSGKWIYTGKENVYGGTELQCPFCGDRVMVQHPLDEYFCRRCGAELRKHEHL